MIFSTNSTHATTRHLHQRQILGFRILIQAWNVRSWARATEFVNLKSQFFFFLNLLLQVETTKLENHCYCHACIDIPLAKFYMWNVKQKKNMM